MTPLTTMSTPVYDRPTHKVLRITRRTESDDSHMSSYPYTDLFYRGSPSPTPDCKGRLQPHARGESTPKNNFRALARGRSALAQPPLTASANADDDYLTSFLDDLDIMDYSSAVDIVSESLTESDSNLDAENIESGSQSLFCEYQELELPGRPTMSADQRVYVKVLECDSSYRLTPTS
ncbi:hypothetical protein SCHPADRAFT_72857 [Schizopora paradoxa]|uniref:Uncharacterized protein n=1 Tax=Schizopora paradoxa TaxID=27342 RepID=A0A0H2S570_9AGAM|nr:hypothetical protein SCHPADRAFT_72857 [Schizopora paradoxa]